MPGKFSYHIEPFERRDRAHRFLEALAAILRHSNYGPALDVWARTSTRCARCAVLCPVYLEANDVRCVPCRRSELVLRIYRRHFMVGGALRGLLPGSTLDDRAVDELAEELYRCTACRRCKTACPMGIDHGLITHLGRWALAEIGIVPKALRVSVREQLEGKTGNTSGIPLPALLDTLEFLEEDLAEKFGRPIKFPVDVPGAEMVFFPAVSDYLLEPDTLMGIAAVMHATGGSWTIGSQNYDGINYGLFYSDRFWDRIVKREVAEVRRLGGKKILIGECGHASRAAKVGVPNFCGIDGPPVVNIIEYTAAALRDGRLKLKPGAITERVTYHDPCNFARSGWIVDQPREILRAICADYVEMTPAGPQNFCCGGGSGLVSLDEVRKWRTGPSGRVKADQLRATGARYVVAPCANCKKQLKEVIEDNKVEGMEVIGLHDLVLRAIDLGPAPAEDK